MRVIFTQAAGDVNELAPAWRRQSVRDGEIMAGTCTYTHAHTQTHAQERTHTHGLVVGYIKIQSQ